MRFRKVYSQLIKLFVTAIVIGWIIYTYGWSNIVETVSKAKISWLVGGFLLNVISVYLGACQWHILLENKGIFLPFPKTVKLYFMGTFFNNFIFGTVAGDAFKVASLHLDKRDGKTSFAATFLDRLAGLLTLSSFAIIGGTIILIYNLQQNKQLLNVLSVLALFIAIVFVIFFLMISRRLQNFVRSILDRLPQFPLKELLRSVLEETFINRRAKEERAMLAKVAFLSIIIQGLRVTVHIFCAIAFGIFTFATMHYFFVIVPVVALLMIIPMPFGIRETVGGILFGLAGFLEEESIIMEFLATILGIAASMIGGIMFVIDKKVMQIETFEESTT